MAVGTFTVCNAGIRDIVNGEIDPDSDTIVAVLVDVAHTAAVTDDTYSDISTNECDDGDYSAQVVANVAVTEAAGITEVDADDVSFGDPVTISAKYIYLLKRAGGSLVAGDKIIGYMDLNDGVGENVSSVSGSFTVGWHATNGIFRFQRAA